MRCYMHWTRVLIYESLVFPSPPRYNKSDIIYRHNDTGDVLSFGSSVAQRAFLVVVINECLLLIVI